MPVSSDSVWVVLHRTAYSTKVGCAVPHGCPVRSGGVVTMPNNAAMPRMHRAEMGLTSPMTVWHPRA